MLENELSKAQRKLHVQDAIIKEFASSTKLEITLHNIIRILCKEYGWSIGVLWLADKDQKLNYITSYSPFYLRNSPFIEATKKTVFRSGEGIPGTVFQNKKTRWLENFQKYASKERGEAAQTININTAFVTPIILQSKALGAIEFLGSNNERPNKEFTELIMSMETQFGHYIKVREADLLRMRSEEKSKTITELAPAIIYTLNETGKIISLNSTVKTITGISIKNLLGKPLSELICPDNRDKTMQLIESMRNSGEIVSVEASIVTKGKETFIAEIKEKTKILNDGTVERIGIIRDVTERYYLEKQKDLWVGIATHELKTPLTSIKAFTQILEQKVKASKNKEYEGYLNKIDNLTNRMAELINDLLDVTKINSGALEIIPEDFSLPKLVNEIVEYIGPASNSHKIICDTKGDGTLNADRQRVGQVLNNLLSNAVKYSPEGAEIIVKTVISRNNAIISVQDFGIGIPKNTLDHVFELFYRGGNKLQHKTSGLGLGLFIVNAIVTAHKGRIWAESKVGKGSTFYVQLPLNNNHKEKS